MASRSDLDSMIKRHATPRGSPSATWRRWPAEVSETLRELHRRHHDPCDDYCGRLTMPAAARIVRELHGIRVTVYHLETWVSGFLGLERWSDRGAS